MEMRDVVGYEDYYAVTDDGRVLNKRTGNWLKLSKNKKGYVCVSLYEPGFPRTTTKHTKRRVHRLVCEAFHGSPPDSSYEVDHVNGVKDDNRAENLEWVTTEENRRRAIAMGLQKPDRPLVAFNREGDVLRFASRGEAEAAGFDVCSILQGYSFTCRGYAFVDAEDFEHISIGLYFEQMEESQLKKRRAAARALSPKQTNINSIIRLLMEGAGCSQNHMAKRLGVGWATVRNFLNGQSSSFLVRAIKMLDELGYKLVVVPKDYLPPFEFHTVRVEQEVTE